MGHLGDGNSTGCCERAELFVRQQRLGSGAPRSQRELTLGGLGVRVWGREKSWSLDSVHLP